MNGVRDIVRDLLFLAGKSEEALLADGQVRLSDNISINMIMRKRK